MLHRIEYCHDINVIHPLLMTVPFVIRLCIVTYSGLGPLWPTHSCRRPYLPHEQTSHPTGLWLSISCIKPSQTEYVQPVYICLLV